MSHQSNNDERLQFEPQQSKENTINCSIYWMKWTRLGWGPPFLGWPGLLMKRKNLWNWIKISRKRWSSHSSGAAIAAVGAVSKSGLQCSLCEKKGGPWKLWSCPPLSPGNKYSAAACSLLIKCTKTTNGSIVLEYMGTKTPCADGGWDLRRRRRDDEERQIVHLCIAESIDHRAMQYYY